MYIIVFVELFDISYPISLIFFFRIALMDIAMALVSYGDEAYLTSMFSLAEKSIQVRLLFYDSIFIHYCQRGMNDL